jgi:hypothetical protein
MKKLLLPLALVISASTHPAMAQYDSAPDVTPGYDWRAQRGNQDWRNNTWREQRFDRDWRNNNWRQQRANEDWRERGKYMKERAANNATDIGYSADEDATEKTKVEGERAERPLPEGLGLVRVLDQTRPLHQKVGTNAEYH